jgi:hypothetical protein
MRVVVEVHDGPNSVTIELTEDSEEVRDGYGERLATAPTVTEVVNRAAIMAVQAFS